MKSLTLLRHAKSGLDNPALRDFDRPLNARGQKAARKMGAHAHDRLMIFDWVVASPALRVEETLGIFLAELEPPRPDPVWDRRAYLASAATLLDIIRETPDDAKHLLLAGHNPGIEELALRLAEGQRDTVYASLEEKYPTGALACLRLDCISWSDAGFGTGTLERFVRPRDIDPTLGPEY
ncbi:histidine phosphatase family protein [Sphingorhabdus soli]|uniref:Histidine phosphatase family protein n=1 Tax=Flavisphingopyxis soli TaxID=2601267 RepID=A0A5C6UL80_9SPHN|nr:histidine phosphatase family protein [Sphingorhabdus soli]TXC73873.1 histidine phosphatase family protein [Sphingorhabdus soli]